MDFLGKSRVFLLIHIKLLVKQFYESKPVIWIFGFTYLIGGEFGAFGRVATPILNSRFYFIIAEDSLFSAQS